MPAYAYPANSSYAPEGQLVQLGDGCSLTPIAESSFTFEEVDAESSEPQGLNIQPKIVNPNTNSIFRLEYLFVCPIVFENGELKFIDYGYKFVATSSAPTTIRANLSLAQQNVLKNHAVSLGYEPLGWYLMGSYYAVCYIPIRIDYRVYSHNQNGGSIYGTAMRNGYNDLALPTIFPEDATQPYTYGIEDKGVMTVYYPPTPSHPGGSSASYYPNFVWTVTFKNS